MKKHNIDKEFLFSTKKGSVKTILTSHLFKRREYKTSQEKYHRSFMFKTREQYQNILTAAFEEYNLANYANEGKVALIFMFAGKKYGMLLDIDTAEEANFLVTVITIDKMRDRHFSHAAMFNMESTKIYTNYEVKGSYLREAGIKYDTTNEYNFCLTDFFNKKGEKYNFFSTVDYPRVFHSIMNRIMLEKLPFGCYWLSVNLKDNKKCFLRVSIESLLLGDSKNIYVILVDFDYNLKMVQKKLETAKEELFILNSMASGHFEKEIVPQKKKGLRIKEKKQTSIC